MEKMVKGLVYGMLAVIAIIMIVLIYDASASLYANGFNKYQAIMIFGVYMVYRRLSRNVNKLPEEKPTKESKSLWSILKPWN
jgi:uncharacterized membrane protein